MWGVRQSAARISGNLLATIDTPMPVVQITMPQSEDIVAEKVIDKINELIAAQKEATKPEPEPAGVGNKGFFNFKPGNGEEETNAQS